VSIQELIRRVEATSTEEIEANLRAVSNFRYRPPTFQENGSVGPSNAEEVGMVTMEKNAERRGMEKILDLLRVEYRKMIDPEADSRKSDAK